MRHGCSRPPSLPFATSSRTAAPTSTSRSVAADDPHRRRAARRSRARSRSTPEDTERRRPGDARRRRQARASSRRRTRSTSPTRSGPRALPRQRVPPARHRLDRLPRDPGRHPHDRRPRPAAGRSAARRGGARDRPAHRHDRLGQVDHARRDDRPHQHDDAKHIVTIEDPIEFLHLDKRSMINQREVGQDTASFKRALRRVLRQDPDVILIGEMRDEETVHTALTAAETGHLVLSTLHTVDAAETDQPHHRLLPAAQQQQVRAMLAGTLQGRRLPAPRADRRRRPRRGLRDPAHDRPRPRHDHGPGADRAARRGHRRGRVLRHADLRPGAVRPPQGRPRHDGGGGRTPPRARTTSSCCSPRSRASARARTRTRAKGQRSTASRPRRARRQPRRPQAPAPSAPPVAAPPAACACRVAAARACGQRPPSLRRPLPPSRASPGRTPDGASPRPRARQPGASARPRRGRSPRRVEGGP